MYSQEMLLPLSGLQHMLFCERQCALIHIERQWEENYLTAAGMIFHRHVDSIHSEKRKLKSQEFGLPIRSLDLGLIGKADAVEFKYNSNGIIVSVIPIEYKRGSEKKDNYDRVQLCAQGMCLEEMLGISIYEGYLFYGKDRRRKIVEFLAPLRNETRSTAKRFHRLMADGITPTANYEKKCDACSLYALCQPKTAGKKKSVSRYLAQLKRD